MKAADKLQQINFRELRAQAMASAIMLEIQDVAGEADLGAIHNRLLDVLHKNGAAWTTEPERIAMGFEPRDEFGWTPTERVEAKQQHLDAMHLMASALHQLPSEESKALDEIAKIGQEIGVGYES